MATANAHSHSAGIAPPVLAEETGGPYRCGCVCHELPGYDCVCPADDPGECGQIQHDENIHYTTNPAWLGWTSPLLTSGPPTQDPARLDNNPDKEGWFT